MEKTTQKIRETAARFPWYAELLRQEGTGTEIGDGTPPLLTADLLDRLLYDGPPPSDLPSLRAYTTSGTSSGQRKTIYYTDEDERRYVEIKSAVFASWLAARPGTSAFRRVLSDMGTGHAAATAQDVFERIGLKTASLPFDLPIERHLDTLASFKPDVLYTMPSILDRIVRAAPHPERLGIRRIITVGEIAPPAWQSAMAQRFGIADADLLDTYGSIEIGTIAVFAPELGRYVLADGLHAEAVGAEELGEGYEALPPDEKVLVLTSFARDAFPAVRYVTYDVVRDFRTMSVGGRLVQTFLGIVKRLGPELKHGEKISLYDIEEVVLRYDPAAEWRVEMRGGRLTLHVRSRALQATDAPDLRRSLENKIPEIGAMIRGGILAGMAVDLAAPGERPLPAAPGIKSRKIHYGSREAETP